ncbi:MAG: tetratricopeptide repeat protein [Flavobacteriales bacterium]
MNHDTHIGFPTEQELIQYHQGQLDRARVREIEEMALDHPMLMEALEGFAIIAAPASLVNGSNAVRSGSWKFWVVGLMAVAGVVAAILFMNKNASIQQHRIHSSMPSPPQVINATPIDSTVEVAAVVVKEVSPVKITKSKEDRKIVNDILDPLAFVEPISPIDSHSYPRIVNKDVTLRNDNLEYRSAGEVEIKRSEGIIYMGKILFIRDFKIVDYTLMRRNDWVGFEPEGGVEAQYEDEDKQNSARRDQQKTEQTIGYLEYLEEAIAFVEKQQWKQAIQRFEVVLAQYPDDVNALFYGGYCAYQNEDFVMAETWLARSLESPIGTFREENKYHLAKVFMARNKFDEARTLLREIVEAKGFYAVQAQSMLEQF